MTRDTVTLPLFDRLAVFNGEPKKLRPYQARAIQALRNKVRNSPVRKICLVAPTASGKMTMIASIIQTSSLPVLFIAHRQELIDQCVEELGDVGISNVGVIRGDDARANPSASVQVASVQTLSRRKDQLPDAGIVLIDECHRSLSDSFLELIAYYSERGAIIIGFTATPVRTDNRPLGNVYEHMEIVTTYEQLIKDGFIVAPRVYGAPDLDLSTIQMLGGDYNEDQLGDFMRDQKLVGLSLAHWRQHANKYLDPESGALREGPYRRTFIFAVTIQHSLDVCERFAADGVRIEHIDGTTSDKRRRSILRALGDGTIDCVSNVGVLLEGVDVPSAKCVVHLRPTQSLVLWRQSVMRIGRPWHPGCRKGCMAHPSIEPLLLDHSGNIWRHGFAHEDLHWELTSKPKFSEKRMNMRVCPSCYAYMAAYKAVCPYCGAGSPPPEPSDLPRETEQQLKRLSVESPEEMRKLFFRTILEVAKKKGHKPGFAAVRFKERYGMWPPFAWSKYAKEEMFMKDPEWQANLAKKEAIKKARAEKKAAREAAEAEMRAPVEEEKTEEYVDDEDIPF